MPYLKKRCHGAHGILITFSSILIIYVRLAYATSQTHARTEVHGSGLSTAGTLPTAGQNGPDGQVNPNRPVPTMRIGLTENRYKRQPYGLTMKEGTEIATWNSGNIIWAYGAERLIDTALSELVTVNIQKPEQGPVQALLIPTANLLYQNYEYHRVKELYDYFRRIMEEVNNVPAFMVGVGLQIDFQGGLSLGSTHAPAARFNASAYLLHPRQAEFFKKIKESGGMVGVRGKLTEAVYLANGLPPPVVLGCPSLFINHNPTLGALLMEKWNKVLQLRDAQNLRLAVGLPHVPHQSGVGPNYAEAKVLIQFVADIFKAFPKSFAVFQTPPDAIETTATLRTYGVDLGPNRTKYFYDAEHWVEGLRASADLLFGFRMHGTMAGVAAEVPGIIISTDFRVQELAEQMALATTTLQDPLFDVKPFNLYNFMANLGFNGSRFDERRRHLASEYVRVFNRVGIPLNPGIKRIAGL